MAEKSGWRVGLEKDRRLRCCCRLGGNRGFAPYGNSIILVKMASWGRSVNSSFLPTPHQTADLQLRVRDSRATVLCSWPGEKAPGAKAQTDRVPIRKLRMGTMNFWRQKLTGKIYSQRRASSWSFKPGRRWWLATVASLLPLLSL